ncbi:hypothetical protein HDU77_003859, partial [Chytriomyces hyalinus]
MKKGRFDDRLQKRLRGLKTANVKPREFSLKSRFRPKEPTSSTEQTKSETKERTDTLIRSVHTSSSTTTAESNATSVPLPTTKTEAAATVSHPALQPIRRSKRKKKFDVLFEITNKENKDSASQSNAISEDVAPDISSSKYNNNNNNNNNGAAFFKTKKVRARTTVVAVTDSLNDPGLPVAASRESEVAQESETKVSRLYGDTLSVACGDYKVDAISVDEFVDKMRVAVER